LAWRETNHFLQPDADHSRNVGPIADVNKNLMKQPGSPSVYLEGTKNPVSASTSLEKTTILEETGFFCVIFIEDCH
jgi:hypothetical protein